MIPWQIKEAIQALRSLPARREAAAERIGIQKKNAGYPTVAFGGVLSGTRIIHGGAVKLLHLREAFASDEDCFNLLYLVSSAQPAFALDLVHLCKSRGIPFVWNQNGVGYPGWAGSEAERHNAPMRRLRAAADYIVYQSLFCRDCADRFLGPCDVPGEVLFNPVDLHKFHPPEVPLEAAPLRLLAMGTQNYAERVLAPIRCLKLLRDAGIDGTLTIAGRLQWANAEAEVRDIIDRLDLLPFVRLQPAFTQDEAVELYQAHHILLHPKYLDPCPTVVIEALASGLPVVGSGSGGLPEMVPDDCGVLIPAPVDWDALITPAPEELAAAVQKIAPRLGLFSQSARRHAEAAYDNARWVARHEEIFRRFS